MEPTSGRRNLAIAAQVAHWMNRARVDTEHGCTWLDSLEGPKPRKPSFHGMSLHGGVIGVVLFWLELYGATHNEVHLKQALDTVDHLRAVLPIENCSDEELSMYFGLSGAVYMFELAYQVAGRSQDHESAMKCMAELYRHARVAESNNLTWCRGQEICAGRGGAGLIALWWSRVAKDESAIELALKAGRAVVRRAKPHPNGGMYWPGEGPSESVGFAHGCSGAAYFLAVLYEHTREQIFLDTAITAVYRLQQIALEQEYGGCIIPSTYREGDQEFPIKSFQWCSGSVGIWRPFVQLGYLTEDPQWYDWVHRIALGVVNSGVPEKPGILALTAILCCGDAGIAQEFLNLYLAHDRRPEYLNFAQRMYARAMSRATADEYGMRWFDKVITGQEHNCARTGFMSGTAGVGICALHMDAFESHRQPIVKLPDSPFWRSTAPY